MEFYSIQQFHKAVSEDTELKESLVVLDKFIKNERFLSKIRFLSRKVYLAQYNIKLYQDGDRVVSHMLESDVINIGELINEIVVEFGDEDRYKAYEDLIYIVSKYYSNTASRDEYNSRIQKVKPSEEQGKFGFHGTLYNFNDLDIKALRNYLAGVMNYDYMKIPE